MSLPGNLVPSLDLIRRTVAVDLAYALSRMRVLERIQSNPIGIAYKQMTPHAVGLMALHLPAFNRVVGLRPGDERHIAPLVDWYRENGISPRFELSAGDYAEPLGRELARLGYYQSDFKPSVIGEAAAPAAAAADGVTTERVTTAAAMEEFLDAYVLGWGLPAQHHEGFKANVRPWLDEPDWRLYLARHKGRAGAAAVLYVHDRIAYFADGCTDPHFRGRGLHTALLRHRWRDAEAASVELVCSQSAFLSASHRNMERLGLRVLTARAWWTAQN
jgi:ribosomal protein S18 acetylase RimI-like enzyme